MRSEEGELRLFYNKSLSQNSLMVTWRYKSESFRQDAQPHSTTDGDFLEQKILPFTPHSGSNIHQVIYFPGCACGAQRSYIRRQGVGNSLPGCQGVNLLRSEIPEQSLRPTNLVQRHKSAEYAPPTPPCGPSTAPCQKSPPN